MRRIAGMANPVLRNLEITECYSLLAAAVASRCGTGANWCVYATWASRQAGRTIRGEDMLEHLRRLLERRRELLHPLASSGRWLLRRGLFQPETRLGRLTAELHTPFDAFERASAAVARGNQKVFEEIGFEFARYLHDCPPDAPLDSVEFRAFLDGLAPGDPPGGQRYLRQAFTRFQRQRFEQVPKARVELGFLANLEIGLHEQTRLQPEIRAALDAPYATKERLGRRLLGAGAQRIVAGTVREAITESLMVLSLPGRVLALGTHLDDPFPAELREPVDADLLELLSRLEPVPPAPDDCGAHDWADLGQRMHYMAHFFRAFHARRELFDPPFTAAQLERLARGEIPAGDL